MKKAHARILQIRHAVFFALVSTSLVCCVPHWVARGKCDSPKNRQPRLVLEYCASKPNHTIAIYHRSGSDFVLFQWYHSGAKKVRVEYRFISNPQRYPRSFIAFKTRAQFKHIVFFEKLFSVQWATPIRLESFPKRFQHKEKVFVFHGAYESWHENGILSERGIYRWGKLCGNMKKYDEKGNPITFVKKGRSPNLTNLPK